MIFVLCGILRQRSACRNQRQLDPHEVAPAVVLDRAIEINPASLGIQGMRRDQLVRRRLAQLTYGVPVGRATRFNDLLCHAATP